MPNKKHNLAVNMTSKTKNKVNILAVYIMQCVKSPFYMSGVTKDIYCYRLENSCSSDWTETFFLYVLDP